MTTPNSAVNASLYLAEFHQLTDEEKASVVHQLRGLGFRITIMAQDCTPITQSWGNGYSRKPQVLYDIMTLMLDNRMSSPDIQDFALEFTASERKLASISTPRVVALTADKNLSADFHSDESIRQLFFGASATTDLDIEVTFTHYPEYKAHKLLLLYVPPVLLVLGSFGNLFSFFILRHKSMNRQSIYVYLSILAVFDSLVLYVGLLRQWVGEMTGSDIRNASSWLCKCIIVAGYTCSDVSVWLIVAVTVERYIVVCHPLRASHFCQEVRAKKVVLAIILIFILINFHLFFSVDIHTDKGSVDNPYEQKCNPIPGFEYLVSFVWPWVDALLYGFGPFLLISVLNFVILAKICSANSLRIRLLNGQHQVQADSQSSTDSGNTRMTAMLLTVSFTFLLTTLPMNVSNIVASIWVNTPSSNNHTRSRGILFGTLASLLMYLNHSINFLLYCATGRKFREVAKRMLWIKIRRRKRPAADHSNHIFCSRPTASRFLTETGRSCNSLESQV